MRNWITIQNELRDLNSSLPAEKLRETYSVPDGYFEGFAATVLARIKEEHTSSQEELEELSPLLASLSRKMPFSVPDGYFTELSSDIPAFTQEESIPGFLQEAKSINPYQVPEHYFDELPAAILNKVGAKQQTAKVVSFNRNRWMRIAAAAVIGGLVAVSSFLYFGGSIGKTSDPAAPSEEWIAKKLKNVSDQDLEEFINNTDVSLSNTAIASGKPAKTEVRKMLKDVTTSELDAFLNEVPTDNGEILTIN